MTIFVVVGVARNEETRRKKARRVAGSLVYLCDERGRGNSEKLFLRPVFSRQSYLRIVDLFKYSVRHRVRVPGEELSIRDTAGYIHFFLK